MCFRTGTRARASRYRDAVSWTTAPRLHRDTPRFGKKKKGGKTSPADGGVAARLPSFAPPARPRLISKRPRSARQMAVGWRPRRRDARYKHCLRGVARICVGGGVVVVTVVTAPGSGARRRLSTPFCQPLAAARLHTAPRHNNNTVHGRPVPAAVPPDRPCSTRHEPFVLHIHPVRVYGISSLLPPQSFFSRSYCCYCCRTVLGACPKHTAHPTLYNYYMFLFLLMFLCYCRGRINR